MRPRHRCPGNLGLFHPSSMGQYGFNEAEASLPRKSGGAYTSAAGTVKLQ